MQLAPFAATAADGRLPRHAIRSLCWSAISLLCVAVDFLTGPAIQFPFFYLIPISLAAWYDGRAWGVALAVVLPLVRLAFRLVWDTPWTVEASVTNAGIRVVVFVAFAWLIARTAEQMRRLRHTRQMEAIRGVCSACGRIHDRDVNEWQPLDEYLSGRRPALEREFCPACLLKLGETFDRR